MKWEKIGRHWWDWSSGSRRSFPQEWPQESRRIVHRPLSLSLSPRILLKLTAGVPLPVIRPPASSSSSSFHPSFTQLFVYRRHQLHSTGCCYGAVWLPVNFDQWLADSEVDLVDVPVRFQVDYKVGTGDQCYVWLFHVINSWEEEHVFRSDIHKCEEAVEEEEEVEEVEEVEEEETHLHEWWMTMEQKQKMESDVVIVDDRVLPVQRWWPIITCLHPSNPVRMPPPPLPPPLVLLIPPVAGVCIRQLQVELFNLSSGPIRRLILHSIPICDSSFIVGFDYISFICIQSSQLG